MADKYGRFLVKKLYDKAFDSLEKKAVQEHIFSNMEKYMVHMHATELLEHLYTTEKLQVKNKMFESIFGAKLKFIQDTESKETDVNKVFADHPLVKEQVMKRLADQVDTFVVKGLIRLTFIQKIVLFYVKSATQYEIERVLDEAHKNYLALLGSRDGLYAACILFTVANPKQRKHMVKQLKTETENLVDNMLTTHMGTVFLLKILLTMDDTKLSCKTIIDRALELLSQESIVDGTALIHFLCGICASNIKKYFAAEDYEFLNYSQYTSSKKGPELRKQEVVEHFIGRMVPLLQAYIASTGFSDRKFCQLITEVLCYIVKGHIVEYEEFIDGFIEAAKANTDPAQDDIIFKILKDVMKEEEENVKEEKVFGKKVCELIKQDVFRFIKGKGVFTVCHILKSDLKSSVRPSFSHI